MALLTPFANDAKSYGFEWLRRMLETGRQEGAYGSGDFKVTDGAGADLKVDVAAGLALVKGDTGFRQGLYVVVNDAAIANAVTLDAAHGTNPRIDQIILRVGDTADLGSAGDVATIEKLSGVATAGATLDNRNGAAALPDNCFRLADALVPAAATSLLAANIRDRRTWARGARALASQVTTGYSTTSTTYAAIDSTNLRPRVEVAAENPIVVKLLATAFGAGTTARNGEFRLYRDGAAVSRTTRKARLAEGAVSLYQPINLEWPTFSFDAGGTTGSHLWEVYWRSTSAGQSAELEAGVTDDAGVYLLVEERVQQQTSND